MKLILLLAVLLSGCAETVIQYPNGQVALKTQADATNVTFDARTAQGSIHFHADSLNHSEPTKAAYGGIGTAVGAVTAGVVAGAAVIK